MKETTKINLRNHAFSDQHKNETTGNKSASVTGLGIDKLKLREKITEIVGVRVYSMREIMSGKYPGEYDITKWREEYIGKQNLPPYVIELNHFRTEVDEFTAMIMQAVADA